MTTISGRARVRAQELDDLGPQRRRAGLPVDRWYALGVEEHHPRPADLRRIRPSGASRIITKRSRSWSSVCSRNANSGIASRQIAFEELQVLLAPLERLLHRDHAVPEHACLWHMRVSRQSTVNSQQEGLPSLPTVDCRLSTLLHPIATPASLKISRAMISRWISLVPS